jgi:hypothetical protein
MNFSTYLSDRLYMLQLVSLVFPSLSCLVCLANSAVSILFVLPFLTSVKWLPVCWDCKGSNLIYIVKNIFSFFLFAFSLFRVCFHLQVTQKQDNLYTFISLSNSFYFFILFTLSLPPKRSANVEKNLNPPNNS